jgi:hypothetical protein
VKWFCYWKLIVREWLIYIIRIQRLWKSKCEHCLRKMTLSKLCSWATFSNSLCEWIERFPCNCRDWSKDSGQKIRLRWDKFGTCMFLGWICFRFCCFWFECINFSVFRWLHLFLGNSKLVCVRFCCCFRVYFRCLNWFRGPSKWFFLILWCLLLWVCICFETGLKTEFFRWRASLNFRRVSWIDCWWNIYWNSMCIRRFFCFLWCSPNIFRRNLIPCRCCLICLWILFCFRFSKCNMNCLFRALWMNSRCFRSQKENLSLCSKFHKLNANYRILIRKKID